MVEVLNSAEKYYAEVLKPQRDEFFNSPSSFRTAFNLAGSLFHFHEWVYEDHRPKLEAHFGKKLPSKGEFWATVEAADARFGFIRDLANASKHVRLTRQRSTSMTHVANTHFHVPTFDFATFDKSAFDVSRITMQDGSADIPFDDCATALFDYWTKLLGDLGGDYVLNQIVRRFAKVSTICALTNDHPRDGQPPKGANAMRDFWWKLKLYVVRPTIRKLSPDAQAEKMQRAIMKFVLSLFENGYEPAVIARALVANAIVFVADCRGPGTDNASLLRAEEAVDELLQKEYERRMVSPPSDRVTQFLRRHGNVIPAIRKLSPERKLSPDAQIEKMQPAVMKFVLSLYRNGYEPTVIASALVANALVFVVQCSGPGTDNALIEAVEALEELLQREFGRRMISPPSDWVTLFLRRYGLE